MELQREYVEDTSGLRATITTIPQIDKSVEEPVVGKIRIESVEGEEIDGVRGEELPDIIKIRQPKGDYIKINDENSTVKKGDGLPEEFNLNSALHVYRCPSERGVDNVRVSISLRDRS